MAAEKVQLQVPGYRLGQRIGAGEVGVTYAAEEVPGNHPVVIRVIHQDLVALDEVREAFLADVTRAISLDHPGIVPTLAAGQADSGELYMISAPAPGKPLAEMLEGQQAMAEDVGLALLIDLANTLSTVHDQGLVHGDLHPGNIFVSEGEPGQQLSIAGFGLFRLQGREAAEDMRPPHYLSPEQIKGETPTARSDIYAFGIIAYELLTGSLPFDASGAREVMLMHLNEDPPPPGDLANITPEIELFLFQALSKDPGLRFQDMETVLRALGCAEPAPAAPDDSTVPVVLAAEPVEDDLLVLRGEPASGISDLPPPTPPARPPKPPREPEIVQASGQIQPGEPAAASTPDPAAEDPSSVIVDGGNRPAMAPEPEQGLEFDLNTGTAQQVVYQVNRDVDPEATGLLPRPGPNSLQVVDEQDEDRIQLLPVALGVLTALAVGVAVYRALSGAWPF